MKRVEYVLGLDIGVRVRRAHRSDRGRIRSFTVQLEVEVKGVWRPVVRYDAAHGFPHLHLFHPARRPHRSPLSMDLNAAYTYAEADVRSRWSQYVDDYRRALK